MWRTSLKRSCSSDQNTLEEAIFLLVIFGLRLDVHVFVLLVVVFCATCKVMRSCNRATRTCLYSVDHVVDYG